MITWLSDPFVAKRQGLPTLIDCRISSVETAILIWFAADCVVWYHRSCVIPHITERETDTATAAVGMIQDPRGRAPL
jgi:hypothetical protein